MICVICHGDEIEVREVEEDIRVDSDIVHVPIQVPVCQTCGERYEPPEPRAIEAIDG